MECKGWIMQWYNFEWNTTLTNFSLVQLCFWFFLRKHVDVMYDIKKKFGSQQCNPVAASYDPGFVSTGDSREILQGTAATYAG